MSFERKCLIAGIVFAAVIALLVSPFTHTDNSPKLNSMLAEKQTVKVDIGMGHGSGVLFDSTTVLTAEHVAAKGDKVEIEFSDGTKIKGVATWSDQETDTAIVKLEEEYTEVKGAGVRCTVPSVGSSLLAIGNPLGGRWVHSWLNVASSRAWPEEDKGLVVSGVVAPGMSGGPAFDSEGMVAGLVTALYVTTLGPYPSVSGFGNLSSMVELCKQLNPVPEKVNG